MTTEPLEPLDGSDQADDDLDQRYPDEAIDPDAGTAEVPDDDPTDADPAVPPPEPTNG